jgi:hypothetical protein
LLKRLNVINIYVTFIFFLKDGSSESEGTHLT